MTTGVSSRASASPSTPPTDRVRPSFANSRTNCAGQEETPHAGSLMGTMA